MIGKKIYNLCKIIFPYNRSLMGNGNRITLNILKKYYSKLKIKEVPSGTKVFDWVIPKEWNVKEAWIKGPDNKKFADFSKNNLHLVGYSKKINKKISLKNLEKKLYYLKKQPRAIPYVTSYYKEDWGFCISYKMRKKLRHGQYTINIDSQLKKGNLTYGEILIPGKIKKEIFLSTYICHPSMANNELSGISVTIFLVKWLASQRRKFSYRIVFLPETIGSITYLKKNLKIMKKNIIAGFNVSCVGDNRSYSYLPSRQGCSIADKVALHVLKWTDKNFKKYSWLDRGSDERQYCSPKIDLPIASIMRTKYGEYPEYHTSLDNLNGVVSPKGLEGGYNVLKKAIEALENNSTPITNFYCEPYMSKRNLYPKLSKKESTKNKTKIMLDFISYSDGKNTLLDIAEKCNLPIWDLYPLVNELKNKKIIK
jgi:aminopeptidase-like protein